MCEVYKSTDPIQYESRTRSVRMRGVLTTIRLENMFWEVLTEMAAGEGCTTNQLVAALHDEVAGCRGEAANFASFLRVCCLRYLRAGNRPALSPAARLPRIEPEPALRAVR